MATEVAGNFEFLGPCVGDSNTEAPLGTPGYHAINEEEKRKVGEVQEQKVHDCRDS